MAEEDMAAAAKVREFYQSHPGAPRRIRSVASNSLMSCASRTQQPRRGGDVRGQPVPDSESIPSHPLDPTKHTCTEPKITFEAPSHTAP